MRVKLPDGKIAEFPDDMPQDQVAAVLKDQYTDPARAIDTRTTNVVPTVHEHVQQAASGYKQVAADAAPIVGDIAGTMAGGYAGKALKAPKLLQTLLQALGAGAGSFGGSAAEQKLEGRDFNPREALAQGAVGAGTELGAAAVKPAVKPVLDFMSDLTVGGRQIKNIWRDKIIKRTTQAAETFIEKNKPSMSKGEAGLGIGDTLKKKTDFEEVYKGYNQALKDHDGPISMDSADEFLQGVRDNITGSRDKAIADGVGKPLNRPVLNTKVAASFDLDPKGRKVLKQLIEEGSLDPDDAKYLLAKIWKGHSRMTPRERNLAQGLKDAIVKDLDYVVSSSGATAAELKQTADTVFGEAHEWFKANPTAKRITNKMRTQPGSYFEAYPEKSLDAIFTADPKEIARVRYMVTKTHDGEQAWTAGVFNKVRDIYERNIVTDAAAGGTKVLPFKLADDLEKSLPAIKAMDGEAAKKIEKEIAYYREVAPEFEKRNRPTIPQLAGSAAAGIAGGPAAVAVTEGFGVVSALAVMSPKARKLLSGMTKQTTKAVGHLSVPPLMPAH